MTNQRLKEKLERIVSKCETLSFEVGRILGEIEAEEVLKKRLSERAFYVRNFRTRSRAQRI